MAGRRSSNEVEIVMFLAAAPGVTTSMAARDDVFERDRLQLEAQLAADDARHVEQVFHQPQLRGGVALDDLERVIARLQPGLRAQDARPPQHRVQRRPDLVRHRRKELVFQPRRFFRDVPRALGCRDLVAELALAHDALGDVLDHRDRADDRRTDGQRGDAGALGHLAEADRLDVARNRDQKPVEALGEHVHFAGERVCVVAVEPAILHRRVQLDERSADRRPRPVRRSAPRATDSRSSRRAHRLS